MKLKTLLLGSAASMMAVTSSFAADAVVAEPEAVEYVRVCDAYGAGYFFIPGTERCLRVSGEVRFEYAIRDTDANTANDVDAEWSYRARVAFESANESDFGTIKTYIRIQSDRSDPLNTDGRQIGLQAMTLSIGGLQVGIFDNYWTTNNGYGNLFAMADGHYGYDQAIYAQYTYEVAGFAVTAGVEQTLDNPLALPGGGVADPELDELNIYAGASYGGSWGSAAATVYYDNINDEFDGKVSLDVKPIEGLRLKGWYLGGDGVYTLQAGGVGADYAYGVSGSYTFGDFTPYVGYTGTDGAKADYVAAGVVWRPASADGLVVQGEVNFDTEDGPIVGDDRAYRLRLIKSF